MIYLPGTTWFTILALHETGGNENDLLPVVRAVAPGAAVLSPRLDAMTAAGLAESVASQVKEHSLNAARVCAFGYSTGADLAAQLLLEHPGLLTAAVLLRPGSATRPGALPTLDSTAVLVVAGTTDTNHPPDSAVAVARLLAETGARVDFTEHDADHGLTPQDFALARRWLGELVAGNAE